LPGINNELLKLFEFPHHPGSHQAYLQAERDQCNISLFHYRNHGSDYGRVLAGVQVPEAERAEFARHLAKLGYTHWNETENPAYRLFLQAQ
jgi:threonine dehydratase